jgi:DNA mismatch endonuclease, patch repair protein
MPLSDGSHVDVLTRKQRSYCMSRIQGTGSGPELALRRALSANGLRYRLKNRLTGRPDIVFVSSRVAVFVDGCFWHGCPAHSVKPKTRKAFWLAKIERNRARDKVVRATLRREGWTVLRFWEHDVKREISRIVEQISEAVQSPKP